MTEPTAAPLPLPERLRHAMATMMNDDCSQPMSPERRRLTERFDVMEEAAAALAQRSDVLTDEEANRLEYRGNSVSHWVTRAEARGRGLDRAWQAMAKAGYPADGKTELCDAISAALAQLPPRGEPRLFIVERPEPLKDALYFKDQEELARGYAESSGYKLVPLYAAPTGIPRERSDALIWKALHIANGVEISGQGGEGVVATLRECAAALAQHARDAALLDALEHMARERGIVVDTYYGGDFCLINALADEDDPKRVVATAPTLRAAIDAALHEPTPTEQPAVPR